MKQVTPEIAEPVLAIAVNAVWISALLHGLTAAPGAAWYARRVKAMGDGAETEIIDRPARFAVTNDR